MKVAKTYRNQFLDQKSARFKRHYMRQIEAVDKMLKTGNPVEIKTRDYRAAEVFRRKLYEFQNITAIRFKVSRPDPYTIVISLKEKEPDYGPITIDGKPLEKVDPVPGIGLQGDVELTPEQEEKVAEAMERYREMERKEIDTDDFLEKVFGKGSQDDKEDKP